MPAIIYHQYINAPVNVCFDLARNVTVHTKTTAHTKEKAVEGMTEGLMEEGDWVTWEAKHLGRRQRLTAKIVQMEKPYRFVDVMTEGAFQSFTHTHEFKKGVGGGTIMTDIFVYQSPYGLLGTVADKIFLEKYMRKLLVTRAEKLMKTAEKGR